MIWIVLFVGFILISYLVQYSKREKKDKELKEQVRSQYGIPKLEESFDFNLIGRYFKNSKKDDSASLQIVSDRTVQDLNWDLVFQLIDRTSSKIGQQYLYNKLRIIPSSAEDLKNFESLVTDFQNDQESRERILLEFKRRDSKDGYYVEDLINGHHIVKPSWYPWVFVSIVAIFITMALSVIYPWIGFALIPLLVLNMFFHYWNKKNINYYKTATVQFDKYISSCLVFSEMNIVRNHFSDLSFIPEIASLKKDIGFLKIEGIADQDPTQIFYSIVEFAKSIFNIDIILTFRLISILKKKTECIHDACKFLGELDSAISVASLREGLETYCSPIFVESKDIEVRKISHPLILNCVENDLILHDKSLLLTGSNMAGKTTFIRSVAINAILAQTINTCFADYYKAPYLKIFSSIRMNDDIVEDKSYYQEEVSTVKEFIDQARLNGPCLFTMDELFKGTNTMERVSGGKAVLSYLNKGKNIVLVATHDVELSELLKDEFHLSHFSESISSDALKFDYKIKDGLLKTRNAIRILELNDYPQEIIIDANETLARIEK